MKKKLLTCLLCLFAYMTNGQTFDAKSFYKIYNDRGEVMDNGDSMDNSANIILGREAKGTAGQLFRIIRTEDGFIHFGLPAYEKAMDYTGDAKADVLVIQWDGWDANIHSGR